MYRIMNNSTRSFIVRGESVLKGGVKINERKIKVEGKDVKTFDVRLDPGNTIYEIENRMGKDLSTYRGIVVVEVVK